jgi:CDP-paratose 2-epimerase
VRGQAFNIGGGIENSLSLLELFSLLEGITGAKLIYEKMPVRSSDQRVFVASITKAKELLNWQPMVSTHDGISRMLRWIETVY